MGKEIEYMKIKPNIIDSFYSSFDEYVEFNYSNAADIVQEIRFRMVCHCKQKTSEKMICKELQNILTEIAKKPKYKNIKTFQRLNRIWIKVCDLPRNITFSIKIKDVPKLLR